MERKDVWKSVGWNALLVLAVIAFVLFIYGSYLVVKPLNYEIFYEEKVRETVRDMVKEESLQKEDE